MDSLKTLLFFSVAVLIITMTTSEDSSNWPSMSYIWYPDTSLPNDQNLTNPPPAKLEDIVKNSQKFPIKFPIESVRCNKLKQKLNDTILELYINSVYPVLHEKALQLCVDFLSHKKRFGNAIEAQVYQNMTVLGLVDRLIAKRAVSFMNANDAYVLLDGTKGYGWEKIGTPEETPPLQLEHVMSYDELKLSALLSVSSMTYFINNGSRFNAGIENRSGVENDGVIIGLIGPRFEVKFRMEYCEVVKSKEQNNHVHGYGESAIPILQGIFLNFYGEASLTYEEMEWGHVFEQNPERFVKIGSDTYFDKMMYSRRIALSIDTLLIEANARAKKSGRKAFVHVVGLGLGVWKLISEQNQIFADTFAKRMEFLGDALDCISDVYFAYIGTDAAGKYKDGDVVSNQKGGIKVHFGKREPHQKLIGDDEGKLLVVSYAWDSNALPGNEFWKGSLTASGDPAAACSTQVAELHNPHINPALSAANLRVATLKNGLLTFQEFQEMQKKLSTK